MTSKPIGRRRRWLVALGAAIVLGYGFYLGSANWFLSSSAADRIINRKPEKLRIDWSRARTWLPGVVVLDDVKIAGANRQFDWTAEMDHVLVEVALWRLPFKTFSSELIVGQGLVFHLEQHEDAAVTPAAVPA